MNNIERYEFSQKLIAQSILNETDKIIITKYRPDYFPDLIDFEKNEEKYQIYKKGYKGDPGPYLIFYSIPEHKELCSFSTKEDIEWIYNIFEQIFKIQ
jgi:hypothetical protein